MAIIRQTFLVTMTIDTERAKEWKDGRYRERSFPNWDIEHGARASTFITHALSELKNLFKYNGLSITVNKYWPSRHPPTRGTKLKRR